MSTQGNAVLSVQEQAIESGSLVIHGTVSDRVLRMYEAVLNYGPPRAFIDRAVAFTEVFKETEGEPTVLRWAKGLMRFAETSKVTILPDELIVGRPHWWLGRCGIVYPEIDGAMMTAAVDAFEQQDKSAAVVAFGDDDPKVIKEVLTPYWAGKEFQTNFVKALPEQTRFMMYGSDRSNMTMSTLYIMPRVSSSQSMAWTMDFEKLIKRGVKGIREEARQRLDALTDPLDLFVKKPFYDAVVICCDAMTLWAKRYAEHARALAAKEKNAARKKELLEIAEICEWVPENPARTFQEALQMHHFASSWARFEVTTASQGQGRMDQFLYPFYEKDLADGRITRESAKELLQCLWVQLQQVAEVKLNPQVSRAFDGYANFMDVSMGGVTPGGKDATNDLTYLMLESLRALKIAGLDPCVRIHANTPDALLHAVAEYVKDGCGFPKLINDEMIVPFYLANGVSFAEANDYAVTGCVEQRIPNRETHVTPNTGINYGGAIEVTLRNGRFKSAKDAVLGLETGDPRSWTTWDQVWNAFSAQVLHMVKHAMESQYTAYSLKAHYFAEPVTSMVSDLAMEAGRDLQTHGDPFPGGLDHSCLEAIGKGTAVDSLAAIKHLIFDTKRLTWDQLLTALEANWEGHEAIRQLCLNAPKYGNGIEWVDNIGYQIETLIMKYLEQHPKPGGQGQSWILRQVPVTYHNPAGRVCSATPNGRPAGIYLSEGISPSHGCDLKGPTVSLASMANARNTSFKEKGPDLINMKFSPATVAGEAGTQRLMQLIRTWSSLKLWHIQFNIINLETLRAAQKNPEKYRNLLVRVAGYSAYFTELSPSLQDEVISRTEEKFQ
jgi:pyruvate formate-lyase/glycerol dehydratase family glycyl radical enzyme